MSEPKKASNPVWEFMWIQIAICGFMTAWGLLLKFGGGTYFNPGGWTWTRSDTLFVAWAALGLVSAIAVMKKLKWGAWLELVFVTITFVYLIENAGTTGFF